MEAIFFKKKNLYLGSVSSAPKCCEMFLALGHIHLWDGIPLGFTLRTKAQTYLIFVTSTTSGAGGEKICHVEKFFHVTVCHVEKFLHMRNVNKIYHIEKALHMINMEQNVLCGKI